MMPGTCFKKKSGKSKGADSMGVQMKQDWP